MRGIVTLVFDDGRENVFTHVLPLLHRHGLMAVFAVPTGPREWPEGHEWVGRNPVALVGPESPAPVSTHPSRGWRDLAGDPVSTHSSRFGGTRGDPVPLEKWKAACAEGRHELAAHGVTHRALPTLSNDELHTELRQSRDATQATTLVYPGGAHDDRVVSSTRTFFRAARTVRRGFERVPPRDPLRLSSFVATRKNFSVWKWNLRALWALLWNRWLIETYHDVALPSEGARARHDNDLHTVPLRSLEAHLTFLARLPIRITTIRDIV